MKIIKYIAIVIVLIGTVFQIYNYKESEKSNKLIYEELLLQDAKVHFENIMLKKSQGLESNSLFLNNFPDIKYEMVDILENQKELKSYKYNSSKEYYKLDEKNDNFTYYGIVNIENRCIACHNKYKVGEVAGAIKISLSTINYKALYTDKDMYVLLNILAAIIIVVLIVWFINSILKKHDEIKNISDSYKLLSEQYEYAINGVNDGLWDWNLVDNKVYYSKIWKEMLGYKEDDLEDNISSWKKLIHKDDLESFEKFVDANQKGDTQNFEFAHRIMNKNKEYQWILSRGKTIFDSEKKAIRMIGFNTDISDQKSLEIKLKQSQRNLEKAETMANLGHWRLDLRNKDISISKNLGKILGLESNSSFTIEKFFEEIISPKDRVKVLFSYSKYLKRKKSFQINFKIYKGETKEKRFMNCNIDFITDKENKVIVAIGAVQDITSFIKIESELKILRQAVEEAPISIVITDKYGNIEYTNPSFTKVSGYQFEEVKGKNPSFLKSEYTDESEYEELWDNISNGKNWSGTFKNIDKYGNEFWELALISPIFYPNSNKISKYIAIKEEVTKEVYLKQELKNKEELMIVQSRHAAMGEMLSMIAHQWRQPITVISMSANNMLIDMQLGTLTNESVEKDARDVIDQTEYLSQTIEDFRNFFRPNKEKVNTTIKELLNESFIMMEATFKNSDIEFVQNIEYDIEVCTYKTELLQVLINIFKNAQEILLEKNILNKKIYFNQFIKDNSVIIEIVDNAGGIPENILDKIFEPYFTTKNQLNGTGLGLYMSKIIVENNLNGILSAYNKDEGACFEIKLNIGEQIDG